MTTMTNRQAADAVHSILSALEKSLREDRPLPKDVALFCADCFASFVNSKAWLGIFGPDADEEFASLDRSQESAIDRVLGTGVRLSEPRLRKICTAFCVAFGFSRHPKKDPMHYPRIPGASASSQEPSVQIPREFGLSAPAKQVVVAAEGGAPGALRLILGALVRALRDSRPLHGRYVAFCADALRMLLDDSEAWEAIGQTEVSTDERRIIGRTVCRAFHLSKSQATWEDGKYPKQAATCPPPVFKFEELLLYRVSQRSATSIILTAFRRPRHRTLTDWLKLMETRSVETGTLGEHVLIEHRLELAEQVERATISRRNLEQAYLVVARNLACKLFPDFRAQIGRWATRLCRDAQRRPRAADQVELAARIRVAIEQNRRLPSVPSELTEKVLPRIRAERATTRLPERAIRELLPAVREAHRFALSLPAQ